MKKITLVILFTFFSFCGGGAMAQATSDGGGTPPSFVTGKKGLLPTSGEETGEGFRSYIVTKFIPGLANVAITILWSISTIFIIIAGVIYLVSSGESEMLKKAKDIIMWTIIGTSLATLSYAIVKLLIQTDFSLN